MAAFPYHQHLFTPWRIRYSDANGIPRELALGAANTVLVSGGAAAAPSFSATLSGLTLTAPTIADFTNAAHDHGDADDGGAITLAAIPDRSMSEFWPADAFALDGSTRVSGGTTPNIYSAIQLDDAVTEGAYIVVRVPDWVVSGTPTFTLRFAPQTGAGGNVRLQVTVLAASLGTDLSSAGTSAAATAAVSTTAHGLRFSTISPGVTLSATNFIRLQIERLGGDAADTYGAAINFIGVAVNYTADH